MPIRSRFVVVLAIVGGSLVSGGWLLGRGMRGGESPYARARLFDDVVSHVERLYVDSLGTAALFEKAMEGMLEELGDPHTLYLAPDRLRRLTESTTGNYTGLGLQVDVRDGWPTVIAPLPGGPAERAGLSTGDRIVEVAGKPTKGLTGDEMRALLRGPVGSKLVVVVERPGVVERLPVTLTRGEIHRRAVRRSALLEEGVGYVDVKIFSDSTDLELSRSIDSLARAGMRSLILDLRANPGGLLAQGVSVADLFLDPGTEIVEMKGRVADANRVYEDRAPQRWATLPVVVLIDEGSASASEIVAGALQDHDRAVLMGRATFGKGSAQSLYPTSAGGALKLTTARWYTPVGRSIERARRSTDGDSVGDGERPTFRTRGGREVYGGGGITPDIVVGDTTLSPAELALQTALGGRVPAFRDALTAYAIALKTAGTVRTPDFDVTPGMFDGLWRLMQQRGFDFDRSVYDGASPLVGRLLAREVSRFVFGPAAEAHRSIRDDDVIRAAASLLGGVATPDDLLRRAAERSGRPASPPA